MHESELFGFLLNGPWRNDACIGYATIAMERSGLDYETIQTVLSELARCFDNISVDDAAKAISKRTRKM